MPQTHSLEIIIGKQTCEIGSIDELGLRLSYGLEDPENFREKQSSMAIGLTLPATNTNDQIFNSYHNPNVIDMTGAIAGTGISSLTPVSGGLGYTAGDILTVTGGTTLATIMVTSVDGAGKILSFVVVTSGKGYILGSTVPFGGGTGAGGSATVSAMSDGLPSGIYTNPRQCTIVVNGVEVLVGTVILRSATHTRLPGSYTIDSYGNNGDWIIDMQDLTLWDCLSLIPHNFDVATVQASWDNFDSDEFHDYVYCPVRYRQPFGDNDDSMNIYHLRPSLSIYWMLVRGFRQFGYSINSEFLNNVNHFRKMVMPWVFGDFFDINSQITDNMSFKAVGPKTPNPYPASHAFWTGDAFDSNMTAWGTQLFGAPFTYGSVFQYVKSVSFASGPTLYNRFRINQTAPPDGFDNFNLYSFDDATGTMIYNFNLPPALASVIGSNVTAHFAMNLIAWSRTSGGDFCHVHIEITHIFASGAPTTVIDETFTELDLGSTGSFGSLDYPTTHNFYVSNLNQGDILKFRLKIAVQSSGSSFQVNCASLLNTNPGAGIVPGWYYNPTTQKWENTGITGALPVYQQQYSTFSLVGLLLSIGGPVHFRWYDKFRSLKFLDLLRGLVDTFDWSIQTNPITKMVTIEPTHDYTLPDGTVHNGYFKKERLDWSDKQDISKENTVVLFSDGERQFDFSFKGDGSDGAANIFAARYKGVYLNNRLINSTNNTNTDNGLISAIPGASRFMFPGRFRKGSRHLANTFFSATMHYKHTKWNNIWQLLGGSPADNVTPQLICIIPENVSDTSASAVAATFEPKIAYYAGKFPINAIGGWRWQGDPVGRGYDANGVGIPTYNDPSDRIGTQPLSGVSSIAFQLPYMFSVDYTGYVGIPPGTMAPVLSYCDQLVNGVVKPGLMKTYFLKRLAKMRLGKQYKPYMRLQLGDITNWEHQNSIIIDGAVYHLIGIEDYNPLSDDSAQCTFWKVEDPNQDDLATCFPSSASILTSPAELPQFDLKYAPLLVFASDMPQG